MGKEWILRLCDMDEIAQDLFRMYCSGAPLPSELAQWFAKVDFEALPPELSAMAATAAAAAGFRGVPEGRIPRLKGVLKHIQMLNAGMTAGLCLLGRLCNENGIPIRLRSAAAIHLGYPNSPVKHLWQLQASVPEGRIRQVSELAQSAGFSLSHTPYSITARRGNTQCINIQKCTMSQDRTGSLSLGGADFQLPEFPELLLCVAEGAVQSLSAPGAWSRHLSWLADLHCLILSDPDWEQAALAAVREKKATAIRLLLEIYVRSGGCPMDPSVLDRFSTEEKAEALARTLYTCLGLKPGRAKLYRLALTARIRAADVPHQTAAAVCAELGDAVRRKLRGPVGPADPQP